jgi:hypothetical protein
MMRSTREGGALVRQGDDHAADDYSVDIRGISAVEYREPGRLVRFPANMRDHEVYVGQEEVEGEAMTEADLRRATERVYSYLNEGRGLQVDFRYRDGSYWGAPQDWVAPTLSDKQRQRNQAEAERLRQGRWFRQFLRYLTGR